MGHNEDNIWSLFRDLMPLWIVFAFMVMVFYIYAKTPSPPLPRWTQNRYVRWLGIALIAVGVLRAVFQAIHNWRLFYGLH